MLRVEDQLGRKEGWGGGDPARGKARRYDEGIVVSADAVEERGAGAVQPRGEGGLLEGLDERGIVDVHEGGGVFARAFRGHGGILSIVS